MSTYQRIRAAQAALPETVKQLSWVSFWNDMASELLYPVLPLLLTSVLGAPVAAVGVIEGAAEGVAIGLRAISGWLSDKEGGKRRPWISTGYALSVIARPLIAIAPVWGVVLGARLIDRTGKAVRTAPRDALLRESTPPEKLGSAFGWHRAMDTAGAVGGPLVAAILLWQDVPLRWVAAAAILPGIVALLITFRIKDIPRTAEQKAEVAKGRVRDLPRQFWFVAGAWGFFSLALSSDAFIVLRAVNVGLSPAWTVLVYAGINVVNVLLAWPLGALSDRVGRRALLLPGVAVYAIVYLGLAVVGGPAALIPVLLLYGVYGAATDGVARALVGDAAPKNQSGTAYGAFAAVSGVAVLIASVTAGFLWDDISPATPFWVGGVIALVSVPVLWLATRRSERATPATSR